MESQNRATRQGLFEWMGTPVGRLQRFEEQQGVGLLRSYFAQRGTLASGFAPEHLAMLRLRMRRRRAFNRLAALLVTALVGVTFASAFTTNRVIDGLGIGLATAGSLAALLALVLRRPSDEVREAIPVDVSPPSPSRRSP